MNEVVLVVLSLWGKRTRLTEGRVLGSASRTRYLEALRLEVLLDARAPPTSRFGLSELFGAIILTGTHFDGHARAGVRA